MRRKKWKKTQDPEKENNFREMRYLLHMLCVFGRSCCVAVFDYFIILHEPAERGGREIWTMTSVPWHPLVD